VAPVKSELSELKQRVDAVEAKTASGSLQPSPNASLAETKLHKFMDAHDPARKRIAFIGWPDATTVGDRIKELEKFIKLHAPHARIVESDNFYYGPYNDRKPNKVAYAEFSSRDATKRVLDHIKQHELKIGDNIILIKPARTKFSGQRNSSLRKACELIEASPESASKKVEINWLERQVEVNKIAAFTQGKTEAGGTFVAPYTSIVLPS